MKAKKTIALMIAATMLTASMSTALTANAAQAPGASAAAAAALSGEALVYGDFEYKFNNDDTITLTKFIVTGTTFEVPEEIDGKPVVGIGSEAFRDSGVLTIAIPDSITKIGNRAFEGCTGLYEVTLPKDLEFLGCAAFADCTSLEEITIPKTLTKSDVSSSGKGPFTGCEKLQNIDFEEGTTTIANHLFYNCDFIEEIIVPDTVTSVGNHAFGSCGSLKKVVLPASVEKIGNESFENSKKTEIYCYTDSEAHKFADKKELPYVLLDGDTSVIVNGDKLLTDEDTDSEIENTDTEDKQTDTETSDVENSDVENSDVENSDTDSSDTDTPEEPEGTWGDLDDDGAITSGDALTILRASLMYDTLTPEQEAVADVNSDGTVDALDALAVLRASVGFIDYDIIGQKK